MDQEMVEVGVMRFNCIRIRVTHPTFTINCLGQIMNMIIPTRLFSILVF